MNKQSLAPSTKKVSGGFTLIELIMVMGVVSVIIGFFVATYPASQKRARDTQRKSDLKQYQTALESYANKNNGIYPVETSSIQADSNNFCVTDLGFSSGDCPPDPKDSVINCSGTICRYFYQSNGTGTEYVLFATLEEPINSNYWVVCQKGKTGESASTPSGGSCPI